MAGVLAQLGVKKETTWGTPVVVDKFIELNSESIEGQYERMESGSLRASGRVQRSDRWARNFKGAAGTVNIEVMSKNFGFWLEHMMGGTITTTGPTETVAYNHNAKVGSLTGKGFTLQVGRPDAADTIRPFTYAGGKVTGWSLTNSVDGFLMANLDCKFNAETTATGLAAASYPASMEVLHFGGGLVTVGGTQYDMSDVTITADNNLKTDRYMIRQNTANKEPLENGNRTYSISGTLEFVDLNAFNLVSSLTAAGTMADVVAKWEGAILTGASTIKASLICTLTTVRFDKFAVQVQGPEMLTASFEGKAFDTGSANTACMLDYKTLDTTV